MKNKIKKPRSIDKESSIYVCAQPGTHLLTHWRGYRSYTKALCARDKAGGVVTSLAWVKGERERVKTGAARLPLSKLWLIERFQRKNIQELLHRLCKGIIPGSRHWENPPSVIYPGRRLRPNGRGWANTPGVTYPSFED